MSNFSRDKNVSRGGRFEQKIRSRLDNSNSIVTVRSSGSRSLWDVVSITPDKVRLIQAKSSGYLTPKEREDMLSDIKRMPDNVQAEFEYYTSPRVRTNRTIKKAGETDWDKVEERLEYFSKVRGYRKADHDEQNRLSLQTGFKRPDEEIYSEDPDIHVIIDGLNLHMTSKERDVIERFMRKWRDRFIEGRPIEEACSLNDVNWNKVYDDMKIRSLDDIESDLLYSPSNWQVKYKEPHFYTTNRRVVSDESKSNVETDQAEITDFKMGKPKKWDGKVEKLAVIDGELYKPLTMYSRRGDIE